ncbi:hypothetical protein KR093_008850 [Drosophila rubida]|uniref:Renin receptor n=1 Tax=Drosophila rubida TaxID=30044 RepID=A0AAD4K196_9MUSC|nr:hypothetical protein KR093_008850 [Drosophila rubida]
MFRFIVIFSLAFALISGDGLFSVLVAPESLEFKESIELESSHVGDVLLAALGHSVSSVSKWMGMYVVDPFKVAVNSLVVIVVQGVKDMVDTAERIKYDLKGTGAERSLNYMTRQLPNDSVTSINFTDHRRGRNQFHSLYGSSHISFKRNLKELLPHQYWSHRHFIDELDLLENAANNLDAILKPSHVVIFTISLSPLMRVARNGPINEAKILLGATIENMKNAIRRRNESVLMVQITRDQKDDSKNASKSNVPNPFEKITEDGDFPALINIVVWFSFTFALVLAIICYAIATMDPGRDSVLYRVTTLKEFTKKKI